MKTSILFVCLGNICRSPAAEGIMRQIISRNGLEGSFDTDSAGIGGWHAGQLPDSRMRRHGAAHGYRFDSRARQVTNEDLLRFDYIVTMDRENYKAMTAMAQTEEQRHKIIKMADFLQHHPGLATIPDPYYGKDRDFETVIELLEDACEGLFRHLTEKDSQQDMRQ